MEAALRSTNLRTVRGALTRLRAEGNKKWPDVAARALVKEIKRRAPVDTGQYRSQWQVRNRKRSTPYKTVIRVSPGKRKLPGVNYDNSNYSDLWGWLERGTKSHTIRVRKARALHWEHPAGTHHFRQEVRHPGTARQPHTAPAIKKVMPREARVAVKGMRNRFISAARR